MASEITVMQRLAERFPDSVVKTKPGRGGAPAMSYISHALVTERLNEVDPNWDVYVVETHKYQGQDGRLHCAGVTIALTVGGVTRHEAGGPQREESFTNEIKNAMSDAIKRAAMRFGVALYIWDSLVDSEHDDDVHPERLHEEPRRMEPRERAQVDGEYQRMIENADALIAKADARYPRPAREAIYSEVSRATSPAPDGHGKNIRGPAPRALNKAQLIKALQMDGWNIADGAGVKQIAQDIEFQYDGEEIPTNESGSYWPSDIWDFLAQQNEREVETANA